MIHVLPDFAIFMQNIYILHNQTELQGHNGALNGCKVLNNVSLVMVYVGDSQTTD